MTGRRAGFWIAAVFGGLAIVAGGAEAQPARLGERTTVCTLAQRQAGWVATNVVTSTLCPGGGGFATRNNAIEVTYVGTAPSGYQVAVCSFDTTQQGAFVTANPGWVVVGTFRSQSCAPAGAANMATIQRR